MRLAESRLFAVMYQASTVQLHHELSGIFIVSGAYEMKIAPCEWPLAVWLHILFVLGLKCCTVNQG